MFRVGFPPPSFSKIAKIPEKRKLTNQIVLYTRLTYVKPYQNILERFWTNLKLWKFWLTDQSYLHIILKVGYPFQPYSRLVYNYDQHVQGWIPTTKFFENRKNSRKTEIEKWIKNRSWCMLIITFCKTPFTPGYSFI